MDWEALEEATRAGSDGADALASAPEGNACAFERPGNACAFERPGDGHASMPQLTATRASPNDCPFETGDVVFDDVLEQTGTVVGLPVDGNNGGQAEVTYDEDGMTRWRTWGHLKIVSSGAPDPKRPRPTPLAASNVVDLDDGEPQVPAGSNVIDVDCDETRAPARAPARARAQVQAAAPTSQRPPPSGGAGTIHRFFGGTPRTTPPPQPPATQRSRHVPSASRAPRQSTPASTSASTRQPSAAGSDLLVQSGQSEDEEEGAPAARDPAEPELAPIERSRKLPQLPEAKKRGPQKVGKHHNDSKVPIEARMLQYPEQGLGDSFGVLYCFLCTCRVTNQKYLIEQHLRGKNHKAKREGAKARNVDIGDIKSQLTAYFKGHDREAGKSVDIDVMVHRFKVVRQSMWAGVEIEKINKMRPVLEGGGRLTDSAHLRSLIPRILDQEIAVLLEEVRDQYVSALFDGTRRLGEAVNMVLRFCTSDFRIHQRLAAFITTQKHLKGVQAAALLSRLLLKDLALEADKVIAITRDSVAANGVCVRAMQANFVGSCDLLCCAHTITHMGEHFDLPTLSEFMTPWVTLVSNNAEATGIWKSMIGESVCGYSKVRWYCLAEIEMQIGKHFAHLGPFLSKLRELKIGEATTNKMIDIYRNGKEQLELELAAILVSRAPTVPVCAQWLLYASSKYAHACTNQLLLLCVAQDMRQVVATVYDLEGDRLEILLAFRRIEALRSMGRCLTQAGTLPNVEALLRSRTPLTVGTKVRKFWPGYGWFDGEVTKVDHDVESTIELDGRSVTAYQVTYPADGTVEDLEELEIRKLLPVMHSSSFKRIAKSLEKGFEYLESRLTGTCERPYDCRDTYKVFKLAQIMDPAYAVSARVDQDMLVELVKLPPFQGDDDGSEEELLHDLTRELPAYLAAASSFIVDRSDIGDFTEKVLGFWRDKGGELPTFARTARIIFAMTPTSAACERVFSLLDSLFGPAQNSALSDYVGGSLRLNYNKRGDTW